jgi:hypothetical protein
MSPVAELTEKKPISFSVDLELQRLFIDAQTWAAEVGLQPSDIEEAIKEVRNEYRN